VQFTIVLVFHMGAHRT